ncbi:MAG: discoidin domain-containing protein, partial [Verrucomicrobiae bacterium]|nr:discoidin domain-containing protein [Verrucomicrobiae bacterium]
MPSARVRFDWLAFFLILSLSLPGMARVPSSQLKVTASSQEEEFAAAKAIDGDPSSRWSSHFTDGEWLQVDLGQPTEIAGARILWESAYGKDYDLAISDDGQNWTTVATVRDSDGGEDEVYFAPHSARFLKLIGVKRGTGWGYSIFEFEPLQLADVPTASAEGTTDGAPAAVIDGGAATWTGTGALTLQFPEARDVGGLRIQWGDPHPSEFSISVSADGATWTRAQAISGAGGGTNLVYFTHAQAKALKVDWPPGQPAQIREVEIKSGEEGWNPSRHYESLQTILPTGSLPRWLRRQQTFWTIVGVGSDTEETLIGEEGTVEPYAGSFCVMPFVATGGRVWTSEQFTASHTLEKNFLPIPMVSLASDAVSLSVSAVSYGPAGESSSAVRYRLENPGKEPLKATLGLAVRPLQLNPPWQYGGFSAIKSAKINGQTLELNAKPAIHFLSEPSTIAVGDRNAGDAFAWLATGKLPAGKAAADADGIVSALARYDLEIPAGGTRDVVVVFPLHRTSKAPDFQAHPSTFFDRTRREIGAAWEARLTGWDISCPIPGLADVMRSNLAYMLLNRDKAAAQPGPRNYSKSWMRDGSVSTSTYLKFGFTKEAGEYLRWIGGLVGQDGFVPFLIDPKTDAPPEFTADWREYDSQGEYVYAVAQYFAFTGDKKFLQESYPAVKRSIAYLIQKLGERRVPKYEGTEFYGILPESNSHEGYFPAK